MTQVPIEVLYYQCSCLGSDSQFLGLQSAQAMLPGDPINFQAKD
jgi:hypothetical protein